jgi:hypothetical protein
MDGLLLFFPPIVGGAWHPDNAIPHDTIAA